MVRRSGRATTKPAESATEALGWALGWLLAPVAGLAAGVRRARPIHADGEVYEARVNTAPAAPEIAAVARRLAGRALVRLSAALWRGQEWPDVLGIAVRFHGDKAAVPPAASAQDLLLVSATHVFTLPVALLTSNVYDWLANEYHGLATFEVEGVGPCRIRGRWPEAGITGGDSRADRLATAVAARSAVLRLELRLEAADPWLPLAEVRLLERAAVDQRRLRFSPFQDGAGIRPTGFLQALRVGPYRAGQAARRADASSVRRKRRTTRGRRVRRARKD